MMTSFSFSSSELLLGIGVGILALFFIIVITRRYFANKSATDLAKKYSDKKWKTSITTRNKYPDVDVFRLTPYFFRIGLIAALVLTIGAFNWTTYEKKVKNDDYTFTIEEEIEIEIPRSDVPPPPPPPPPPPVIQEVPDDVVLTEEEDLEFVDQSVDAESAIDISEIVVDNAKEAAPPPPPPPPPVEEEEREIFMVVEDMPRFPGCNDLKGDKAAIKKCSDQKLMEFLASNVRYPSMARENGIEGTVVIQFVVEKDGKITGAKVLRDIGGGCGDESLRLVNLMNNMSEKWVPGKQRGRPVPVMFTLPVRFMLEYN